MKRTRIALRIRTIYIRIHQNSHLLWHGEHSSLVFVTQAQMITLVYLMGIIICNNNEFKFWFSFAHIIK